MTIAIAELVLGGLLLVFTVHWKVREIIDVIKNVLPAKWATRLAIPQRLNFILRLFVGLTSSVCLIDPMVSGTGVLEIHAPRNLPTTLDNLRARIVPAGLLGLAGGDYIVILRFDTRGIAMAPVAFRTLEVSAQVDVFDVSRPEPAVARKIVYVPPFVRRQLYALSIDFSR